MSCFVALLLLCAVCTEVSVDPVCLVRLLLKAKDKCGHVDWTEVCVLSLSCEYLSSLLDGFEKRVLNYAPDQTCRCYQIDKD